jgi:hypothetical protein
VSEEPKPADHPKQDHLFFTVEFDLCGLSLDAFLVLTRAISLEEYKRLNESYRAHVQRFKEAHPSATAGFSQIPSESAILSMEPTDPRL